MRQIWSPLLMVPSLSLTSTTLPSTTLTSITMTHFNTLTSPLSHVNNTHFNTLASPLSLSLTSTTLTSPGTTNASSTVKDKHSNMKSLFPVGTGGSSRSNLTVSTLGEDASSATSPGSESDVLSTMSAMTPESNGDDSDADSTSSGNAHIDEHSSSNLSTVTIITIIPTNLITCHLDCIQQVLHLPLSAHWNAFPSVTNRSRQLLVFCLRPQLPGHRPKWSFRN